MTDYGRGPIVVMFSVRILHPSPNDTVKTHRAIPRISVFYLRGRSECGEQVLVVTGYSIVLLPSRFACGNTVVGLVLR